MKFYHESSSIVALRWVIGLTVFFMNVSPINADGSPLPTNFAGYFPKTNVMDAAAIDQDQEAIVNYIQIGKLSTAQNIYYDGANSRSYAEVKLTEGQQVTIPKGSKLMGYVRDDNQHLRHVFGTAMEDHENGDDTLYFLYDVPTDHPGTCQVGALPEDVQKTDGCLQDSGIMHVSSIAQVSYSYDFQIGNKNGRSIGGMSANAKTSMHDCDFCPVETYEKFKDYYGSFTYANDFIQSAFGIERNGTDFNRGGADFSIYGTAGRGCTWNAGIFPHGSTFLFSSHIFPSLTSSFLNSDFIQKGILILNIWMFIIRDMEESLSLCIPGGAHQDQTDALSYWDPSLRLGQSKLQVL
jgi:hypothetical protein